MKKYLPMIIGLLGIVTIIGFVLIKDPPKNSTFQIEKNVIKE